MTIRKRKGNLIKIPKSVIKDLNTWKCFLLHYNGITLIKKKLSYNSEQMHFYTDSSGKGFGGVFGSKYVVGLFPNKCKKFDINVLELYPVFLLINIFIDRVTNQSVTFHSDNMSVVHALKSKQTIVKVKAYDEYD